MKYRDAITGEFKKLRIRATDELPVGSIIEYSGLSSDIPIGWESYGNNQIKKIAETTPITGNVINEYSESTTDAYSANYVNNIYKKTVLFEGNTNTTITLSEDCSNFDFLDIEYRFDDNKYNFTRIYEPNGKGVCLPNVNVGNNASYINIIGGNITLSNNKINIGNGAYLNINVSNFTKNNSSSNFETRITKVIGYKKGE